MSRGRRTFLWSALNYLRSFLLFAASIGMAVTCTFLVFFSTVSLSEEEIRTFAPVVFVNVLVLAAICVGIDALRRYVTVKRPARKIQGVLERLMNGDFDARISVPEVMDRYSHFGEIAEHINALAGELAGVETLRTDFIANVSHELKTPLTSILGTAEILQNGLVKPEDVSHFAGNIHREAGRLIGLVNNIIKLSRLDEGGPTTTWENVDLYQTAKSALDRLSAAAEQRQVTLELRGEPVQIHGVPQIVDEILYNLCDNAVVYNRPGGKVCVTVEDTGKSARVMVEDTGIGIPQEVQSRVFERFYRADKSHSAGGTGLGLSIVKHGAAYLGAKVTLESEEGKGSTFTLIFPKSSI